MDIDTINKTLSNDDRWIYRLWEWADKNNIPDLEWIEDKNSNKGYWRGLPRDKEKLLSLTELNLSFNHNPIARLPKEIGNLTNLKKLFIRFQFFIGIVHFFCAFETVKNFVSVR